MAKYRLSYLEYGGFKAIDLKKLECLKDCDVTDIKIIDKFTTNFKNEEELIEFLRRNEIITEEVNKLYITIDKKNNNEVINKKIYNGDKLFFKDDYKYLSVSFIYKWLSYNRNNFDAITKICDNYIEKYKNAYNRTDGSSYILSIFYSIKNTVKSIKNNNSEVTKSTYLDYQESIEDFVTIEFFKLDKEQIVKGIFARSKDKDGNVRQQYRNIHDFILLLKQIDKDLQLYSSEKLVDENKVRTYDNYVESDHEEFLVEDDFNGPMFKTIDTEPEDIQALTLKPGDGFRK